MSAPIVIAEGLRKHYVLHAKNWLRDEVRLKAVDGASFELRAGRTLAVVGESGCGKSTLARQVVMIETPTAGSLVIDRVDVVGASKSDLKSLRSSVQMVFQDPYGSLNPRQKMGDILAEPLQVNTDLDASARRDAVKAIMQKVGLRPEHFARYPHMFSGGQRQRIAIARALMLSPRALILDEPVSALDISIQAQVLNLLADLQDEFDLAYMFISHDLSVVRHIADEVMVMYLGLPVEQGPRDAIFANPLHPYTTALLSATPMADPDKQRSRIRLSGELPSPLNPPKGCAFHPRCPFANDRCRSEVPSMIRSDRRVVRCHGVQEGRLNRSSLDAWGRTSEEKRISV